MSTSDSNEDGVLFEEVGGLMTEADLHTVYGTSPVRVTVETNTVKLTIKVSAGEVAASLRPGTAEQLGEALIKGAERAERPADD